MTSSRFRMVRACATMPASCLSASSAELTHSRAVFLQDAAIHHHKNSCLARLLCSFLVNHVFLHPDSGDSELDGLVHNLFHKFWATENIDDINLLGHVEQRRVRRLAEAFFDLRIHGNDDRK